MNTALRTGIILLSIVVGLILIALVFQKIMHLLVLIMISIVVTTGIDPLVHRMQGGFRQRAKIPRALATLVVLLLGAFILIYAISFLAGTAVHQAISFFNDDKLQGQLLHWLTRLAAKYSFIPKPATIMSRINAQSGSIISYAWQTTLALVGLFSTIISFFIVLVLSFFFTTFKDGIVHTLLQFFPPQYQQRAKEISHKAAEKMGGWLRGQITLALLITAILIVGMSLIGYLEYAVLIGIIGGIGELIPMVGPYLAFLPALAIASLSGAHSVQIFAIIIFFVLLVLTENYLLAPKIMKDKVGLHPISTILAILTGGTLFGIVGALLAIPISAVGRVLLIEWIFPAIQGHKVKNEDEIDEAANLGAQ